MSRTVSAVLSRWLRAGVACLLFFSGAAYLGAFHPYLELTTHFRAQYFWIGLLLVLLGLGLRARPWALAALLGAALNLPQVWPYYWPGAAQAGETRAGLRLLLANVHTENRDYPRLLELVRSAAPDLAVFQETDQAWLDALAPLARDYPYRLGDPGIGNFGIALFSRLPLQHPQVLDLGGTGLPGLSAEVRINGAALALLALHPPPPLGAELTALRDRQLAAAAEHARAWTLPGVLLGDLNATPWSPVYRLLEQRGGLRNARRGFGVLPTWPVFYPAFMRIPLDHCLHSRELAVLSIAAGPAFGSDHLPLQVEIGLPRLTPHGREE